MSTAKPEAIEATIASGAANSAAIALHYYGTAVGLYATEACTNAISVQASNDGSTWYDVDGFTTLTISAAKYYPLSPTTFAGALYVRVHSAGNEAAERTFYVAVRAV